MKFHTSTKIIFVILAVMIVAGVLLIIAEYPKLKPSSQSVVLNPQNTVVAPSAAPSTIPTTQNQPTAAAPSQSPNGDIIVASPSVNQAINSPLNFSGKAKESWFVNGIFQVRLLDADTTLLGFGKASEQSSVSASGFVNFSGQFTFSKPSGQTGSLIFENQGTAGAANHEDFSIPVTFSTSNTSLQPAGTCAPDSSDCKDNPELCMTENLNKACD